MDILPLRPLVNTPNAVDTYLSDESDGLFIRDSDENGDVLDTIVVDPPPSKFSALYAPRFFISLADSYRVRPKLLYDLPSTVTRYKVLPSFDEPARVRGFLEEYVPSGICENVDCIFPFFRRIQPPVIAVVEFDQLLGDVDILSFTVSPTAKLFFIHVPPSFLVTSTYPSLGI